MTYTHYRKPVPPVGETVYSTCAYCKREGHNQALLTTVSYKPGQPAVYQLRITCHSCRRSWLKRVSW